MSMICYHHCMVLDATALLFRAHFGGFRMRSPRGKEIGALFGCAQFLHKVMSRFTPRYVVLVHDTPSPTFRHEVFEKYKAHRAPVPKELRYQFSKLEEMCSNLGFLNLACPGYEADDLMASVIEKLQPHEIDTTLVSEDKDLFQLVRDALPATTIYSQQKETVFDEVGVQRKFGVFPHQLPDYFALVGDSSDNLPGVSGIGAKTAEKLIHLCGSLEGIFQLVTEIPTKEIRSWKKIKNNLLESKEQAFSTRDLFILEKHAPIGFTSEELLEHSEWKGPLRGMAETFFQKEIGYHRPLNNLKKLRDVYAPLLAS